METWIFLTFAAAFFQTLRFMLQKQLATTRLSATGATFARFVYSAPLIVIGVALYIRLSNQALPGMPMRFWGFAAMGGLAQILATVAVVALFARRNFAVGITLKKTEVIQTALIGFLLLGEKITALALAALGVGMVGVLLLTDPPAGTGGWRARVFNPAAGLGVLSGVFFAFAGVGYRAASLSLEGGDVALRAGLTLAVVTTGQTIGLGIWLRWRSPGQITRTFHSWRQSGLVGLTSMVGSYCWFAAFTLQTAAYVYAVGQIEVIFGFVIGLLVFRETSTGREMAGIVLLTGSILGLILIV